MFVSKRMSKVNAQTITKVSSLIVSGRSSVSPGSIAIYYVVPVPLQLSSFTRSKTSSTTNYDRIMFALVAVESELGIYSYEVDFPIVIFTLNLRRQPLYYVVNLIVPCCLLSLIAVTTFLLQPGCSERLGIGTCEFRVIRYNSSWRRFAVAW